MEKAIRKSTKNARVRKEFIFMTSFMITKDEFQIWAKVHLPKHDFARSEQDELVIRQKNFVGKLELHIYTDLDTTGAIRCVLYDSVSLLNIGRTIRIHVIDDSDIHWERLTDAVKEFKILAENTKLCTRCMAHVVERKNSRTDESFWGCSAFPKCPKGEELRRVYPLVDCEVVERRVEDTSCKKLTGAKARDFKKQLQVQFPPPQPTIPLVEDNAIILTRDYPYIKYPFKYFNRVQSTILKEGFNKEDINLVLGTNTSSGKTIAAEFFMGYTLNKQKKVLYCSPLRSLTNEKYEDWQKIFPEYKICIMTGDYNLSHIRAKELNQADILCLTSEMVDSRSRKFEDEKSGWMKDVGLIIVDESHIISTDRGHAVESGIMRFTKINPDARILFLSATMPNVEDFRKWLTVLNGKKTEVINSDWRPTQLNWHFETYDIHAQYKDQELQKLGLTINRVKEKADEKFLIFVHTKNTGRLLERQLKEQGIDTHFHNANLELAERLEIEKKFADRDNGIRVLISTSTLAWGSVEQDTKILTTSGQSKNVQDFKEGDTILSFNEESKNLEQDILLGVTEYTPFSSYEIELEDGTKLRVDFKHPFYVRDDKDFRITEAKDLEVGDDLIVFTELV